MEPTTADYVKIFHWTGFRERWAIATQTIRDDAYCSYISCSEPVPTEAELNVQEVVEAEDDQPTPAKAKTPSSTRK